MTAIEIKRMLSPAGIAGFDGLHKKKKLSTMWQPKDKPGLDEIACEFCLDI